jgi:WD40 repeat protein
VTPIHNARIDHPMAWRGDDFSKDDISFDLSPKHVAALEDVLLKVRGADLAPGRIRAERKLSKSVAFSPDGRTVASESSGKKTILWDVSSVAKAMRGEELAPCSNAPIYSEASRRPTKPKYVHVNLIFFDYEQDSISPAGFTVLRDAAEFYKKAGNHMQISLIGHTDASEGDDEELSMRRAETVDGALTKLGVPSDAITMLGRGDADMRVPTPPNIR